MAKSTSCTAESIYALVPKPPVAEQKPPLYHSTHNGVIDPRNFSMGTKHVKVHATMGTAVGETRIDPATFTRRRTGKPCVSGVAGVKRARIIRKERCPAKTERPVMGLRSDKDFIYENAVSNIRAAPPPPAGEEARFVFKPDFGRVPDYLKRTKEQLRREREELDAQLVAREERQRGMELPQEERAELLNLLKAKWGEVNTQFLRLPLQLDTPAKKVRKEDLERRLAQIESDIKLLQRGDRLIVVQD